MSHINKIYLGKQEPPVLNLSWRRGALLFPCLYGSAVGSNLWCGHKTIAQGEEIHRQDKPTNVRAAVALSQSSSKVITVLVALLTAQLAVLPVRLLWDPGVLSPLGSVMCERR